MEIKAGDLSYNLEMLFDIVGEKNFIEITKMYGGSVVYIPTYKSTIRKNRNRQIKKRFNGVNTNQLAREYGITGNQIRRIANQDEY